MIPSFITDRLRERGSRHCLIGAAALAAHRYARASMDVDLLTDDDSVLLASFWSGVEPQPDRRRGDLSDPVEGVVRWGEPIAVDLVLSRNFAARFALESAVPDPSIGVPVPSPLALVLLKLEAGGPKDQSDVINLIETRRKIDGASWESELPALVPKLSRNAGRTWTRVETLLRDSDPLS